MTPSPKLAILATLALVFVVTAVVLGSLTSPRPPLTATAAATVSGGTAAPTTVATAPPTPAPVSLVWTEDQLKLDVPLPLRPEPSGFPITIPVGQHDYVAFNEAESRFEPHEFHDASGDTSPQDVPMVDITKVDAGFSFDVATDVPGPLPDPSERWVAYGLVLDRDGDGIGDERLGMDNIPGNSWRAWWTDLESGVTDTADKPPYGFLHSDGKWLDAYYPTGDAEDPAGVWLHSIRKGLSRHYAWSALIEDGRVVASDFAPDEGWLDPLDQPDVAMVDAKWELRSVRNNHNDTVAFVPLEQMAPLSVDRNGAIAIRAVCAASSETVRFVGNTYRQMGHVIRIVPLISEGHQCPDEATDGDAPISRLMEGGQFSYSTDYGSLVFSADDWALIFMVRD